MSRSIIKITLIAAVFSGYSNVTYGQHTQTIHEAHVDDFSTPYPFTLKELQTFTGTIGVVKRKDGEDWWDYYVFRSPGSGTVDIALDNFDRPVSLGLETSFPSGHGQEKAVAESSNRFIDYHHISADISPDTTYYIAVGTGVMNNGFTPYALTIKFTESEPQSFSQPQNGYYELALAGAPCNAGPEFPSLKLPEYFVSEDGAKVSTQHEQGANTDKRILEMFQFEPAQGMLVHEYSEVLLEAGSTLSLQRDIVVVGSFEAGEFHGEVMQHHTLKNSSDDVIEESRECTRKVTAIGQ